MSGQPDRIAASLPVADMPKGSTRPLLAGLLAMLLLVGAGMGMGIYQLRHVTQALESMVHEDASAVGAIISMMRSARERALVLSDVITLDDPFAREEKLSELDRLKGQFHEARARLIALPLSAEEEALRLSQNDLLARQAGHIEKLLVQIRGGDLAGAERFLLSTVIPTQSLVLDSLMEWVDIRQAQYAVQVEQMREQQRQAVGIMFGFGLVALLVGGAVVMVVYRWNTRMFDRLAGQQADLRAAMAELSVRQHAMDMHSIVSEADVQGRITHVNDKFCEISEYRRDELIGANHRIIKSDYHPPEFFQVMWETISSGRPWHGVVRNRAKSGRLYWVETTIVPLLDKDGVPARYISVRTDITGVMEMEAAVREANVILKSNVIERTHELEQAKLQLEQELQERVHTQTALQRSYDELQVLHRQLQDAQQHLMQSEKLAAVGQLAAGMAHEINNPIGFITSNLAALRRYQDTVDVILKRYRQLESGLSEGGQAAIAALRQEAELDFVLEDSRALLTECQGGLDRVRGIVRDLRDFARVDSADKQQWVDLNHCLDNVLRLLGERVGQGVRIERAYGPLPLVECNPAELNQVFLNLLDNALRALPKEGTIHVRSGTHGEQVWVEIEDTGEGIPADALPHLFDPFFTTRPVGQGAGLGLSMAYGVIQRHGGQITVSSQPGAGALFRITLPLRQAHAAAESEPAGMPAAASGEPRHTQAA